METLCHMLDNHPQKADLEIILLPLAKEVFSGYGSVPVTMA